MHGISIRILTNAPDDSELIYTIHTVNSANTPTHSTRPPRPLEAENWNILPYSDFP